MRARLPLAAAAVAASLATTPAHAAATFTIQNNDPAGVGFNDPTAAAPVGGNSGTTVGAQRVIAFTYAASLWGSRITSNVPILVAATFGPLTCGPSSGTLGSAGPTNGFTFAQSVGGFPPNTIFAAPLAEKLHGATMNGGGADIQAQFNGNVGTPGCLQSLSWYYGLDGNPPGGQIDFVSVLLHELGHGLGFLTFVDVSTGLKAGGFDDVYELFLFDTTTLKAWAAMTNTERQASAINKNNVVWTGPLTTAGTGTVTSGKNGTGQLLMYTPNPLQGGSSINHWTQNSSFCNTCTDLLPFDLMKPTYVSPQHTTTVTQLALADMGWGTVKSGVVARGDANADGSRDISDVFYLINYLFAGQQFPLGVGDVNKDGVIDVLDVFYLINFLLAGGAAPPA